MFPNFNLFGSHRRRIAFSPSARNFGERWILPFARMGRQHTPFFALDDEDVFLRNLLHARPRLLATVLSFVWCFMQACPRLLATVRSFVWCFLQASPRLLATRRISGLPFPLTPFFFFCLLHVPSLGFLLGSFTFLVNPQINFVIAISLSVACWTYGFGKRSRGSSSGYRPTSGRPKGAALIHAFNTYKLPFLCSGTTSPVTVSSKHPYAEPKRDSNPMSAHRLKLRSALCTSATCMLIALGWDAPSVHISHLLSPKLGMVSPVATSYSIPFIDWNDGTMGIPGHMSLGMTVSQAPVSAVSSTSYHSSWPEADIGHSDALDSFVYSSGHSASGLIDALGLGVFGPSTSVLVVALGLDSFSFHNLRNSFCPALVFQNLCGSLELWGEPLLDAVGRER